TSTFGKVVLCCDCACAALAIATRLASASACRRPRGVSAVILVLLGGCRASPCGGRCTDANERRTRQPGKTSRPSQAGGRNHAVPDRQVGERSRGGDTELVLDDGLVVRH